MPKSSHNPNLRLLKMPQAEVIEDYKLAVMSRQASLIGRREVLTGKAKFGIFGDGKEVAQIAMAKAFKLGDWRSGYYRDQTLMFALGLSNIKEFFAQLYANTDTKADPASGGRQMNSHFATRFIDEHGNWLAQSEVFNAAADLSPTGSQMAKAVGLAYASKLYRNIKELKHLKQFSKNGNEVVFATIGNATTAEGIFWEALNAAGVLQIPLAISVWDDGYGISVPNSYQMTKESISEIIKGFQRDKNHPGYEIVAVKGWDYPTLVETYQKVIDRVRKEHVPALIHVTEMTQPQGHSTSGSHERYKSKERLAYEQSMDCLKKMREWMIAEEISKSPELDDLEKIASAQVEDIRKQAWQEYIQPVEHERDHLMMIFDNLKSASTDPEFIEKAMKDLQRSPALNRRTIQSVAVKILSELKGQNLSYENELRAFIKQYKTENDQRYSSRLYVDWQHSPLAVEEIKPIYSEQSEILDGRKVIQKILKHHFANEKRLFYIGEDCGKIGGVNAELEGLQEIFGEARITDTGIREATILGQGMGAAMRGLRPIIEIQYLDYLLYCFQIMSDDLASLHWRTVGGQASPVIIRTRGHRLEGIWHAGSPMSTLLGGLRGIHICVPRDMVQAAGMYNTLLKGDDPALVIEVLSGYRLKEKVPDNLTEFTVPLGKVEVLQQGTDITVVTYGACVRIAKEALETLARLGISVELIDVQTLMPFDRDHEICKSLQKTNAVLFLDEDVAGGASAFMMQQVLEAQSGYEHLDAPPKTVTAKEHRPAYGSDGDYYSKPNTEDIIMTIYNIMQERRPYEFPELF